MRDISGPTRRRLSELRTSSAYTAALCDAIILGGQSNRSDALRKIEAALYLLQERIQHALEALAREGNP